MSEESNKGKTPEKPVLVLGEVKVPFNPDNLRETLEEFQGSVKNDELKKIADSLKIKSVPFDKRLLMPVAIGAVQNAFYLAVKGTVPPEPDKNQKLRIKAYSSAVEALEKGDSNE